MNDCNIRYLDFPNRSVKAVTFPNDDGSFDIYLNTLYPEPALEDALRHELEHIRRGHFYSDKPIREKEDEADRAGSLCFSPGELVNWITGGASS